MIRPSLARSSGACTTHEADVISLFVYGTLRSPVGGPDSDTHYHDRIAAHIVSAEPATLDGARLFDLGSYPGLGRGVGEVVGELFEVDASVLDITDEIEGHPEFYVRRIETVTPAEGNSRAAWAYWGPTRSARRGEGDRVG